MKNEIKEIISDGFKSAFGGIIANEGIDHASGIIATALHKKGYRKQSETVKEFATKVNDYLKHSIFRTKGEDCKESVYKIIDKLAEQYGKENE